jgi:hypothetical protein
MIFGMELKLFLPDCAESLRQVDSVRPQHITTKGRPYQPGIGPHPEDAAVKLIVDKMRLLRPLRLARGAGAVPELEPEVQLGLGDPIEWRIEVKMARVYGDNNKPDDTGVKDILSPFAVDRSALADCTKLVTLGGDARKAILIYGFDAPNRPVAELISAFQILARQRVLLGERHHEKLGNLVHPVFRSGGVFAWEVAAFPAS